MTPLISVIIPTYKPGTYLYKCLETVINQKGVRGVEIVLILNGCNEPYATTIKSYADNNDKNCIIQFIQTDVPGVSNARNIGIDAARGEYITFLDDDDFVSATYLSELLRVSDKETVGLSYELRYNETDNTTQTESFSDEYKKKYKLGKQPYRRIKKYFSGPCMKLIHRDVINGYRFDTRYTNGEDSLFMFQISRNMKYVDFTSLDAVYYRRVRTGSAMSKEKQVSAMVKNRLRMVSSFIAIYMTAPAKYSFSFLTTRILGCLHSIFNSIIFAIRMIKNTPPISTNSWCTVYYREFFVPSPVWNHKAAMSF